jgi:hypothetical protein
MVGMHKADKSKAMVAFHRFPNQNQWRLQSWRQLSWQRGGDSK